tara:strand:+ start:2958 stop:3764 length:807 start_codon:yes stop_codon:yes gene_type:complete
MTAQPDFQTFVHVVGAGPRRALALHCTMAFGGAWGGMAKALAGQVTFVAPDMPSHGKSDDWDEQSHLSDTALIGSLAAMDEGPMDVIGHSFGGMTALRLAVSHPARVRSLTLIEPVFFAVARRDAPETLDGFDDHSAPFIQALAAGDRKGAAQAFNGAWGDQGSGWEALPARTRDAMARGVHVVTGSRSVLYDDDRGLLEPGVLDATLTPTLILRGGLSQSAVTATNNGLAARLPNARQGVIAGAGHMAPITHPKETAALWQQFLAQT